MSRIAILSLALLAACSSTPADKGAAAGKTVNQAANEIDEGVTHLDATISSLNALVKSPAPDLEPQFKEFEKHLAQLESSADDVAGLAARISTRSQEYMKEWDAQIAQVQNEDIRERSVERREEVAKSFKKIEDEYAEVRQEFKPLLGNLRDIRAALRADLTMDGIKAVKGSVGDVQSDSEDVKESLAELVENFRKLGAKLSKSGPPAPAKQGG
jgi:DNA repair exonuclease SbcCD ATPase subunit